MNTTTPLRAAPRFNRWSRPLGVMARPEGVLVGLLVVWAFFFRLVFAVTVPPWQSPDEPKHFEYVRLLVDKAPQLLTERRLLWLGDASPELQRQIIASMAGERFWQYLGGDTPNPLPGSFSDVWGGSSTVLHRPSLYYFVAAPFLWPFRYADLDTQLLVVRLASALLSTGAVAATYLCARRLRRDDRFVALVSGAFVAALPMHVFIGGAVNSDNLTSLFGSIFFLTMTAATMRPLSWRQWLMPLLVFLIALASKRAAVGLLPAMLLGPGALVLRHSRRLFLAVILAFVSAVATAVAALTVSPELHARVNSVLVLYYLNEPDQLDRVLRLSPFASEVLDLLPNHFALLFRSFWGIFGWFKLPLGEVTYQVLAVVTAICAVGFLVSLANTVLWHRKARSGEITTLLIYVACILFMTALAIGERLSYLNPGDVPQGRYLFPTITPIAIVLAMGARSLLPRRTLGSWLPQLACVLALVALDVVVYTGTVFPFYGWRFS